MKCLCTLRFHPYLWFENLSGYRGILGEEKEERKDWKQRNEEIGRDLEGIPRELGRLLAQ
jgi:hypothetical protein